MVFCHGIFGAVPVDEEGNYRHKELSPGYKNALKFINNCIQKEYLDVNILTLDEAAFKDISGSRKSILLDWKSGTDQ